MVDLLSKPKLQIDSWKQPIVCFGTITEKSFVLWLSIKWFSNCLRSSFQCFDQSLNAMNSLLRFDNKQHLWIYTEKQIWVFIDLLILSFWKSWDCLEIEIDQRVWARIFCLYWFQICLCNKCNPCICWKNFVCLLRSVVFLRGSRSAFLVLVCWPREVCVLKGSRSLSWLWCKWSRFDCLVVFLSGFWEDWM